MGKVQLQCPSCNGDIELGEVKCPHCGVNLKSGESYETQVKRAKGKARHPEHFSNRLYFAVALATCLFLLAGFMYQGQIEKVIRQRPELFKEPVELMQRVDDLYAAGHTQAAREQADELVKWLKEQDEQIVPPEPYAKEKEDRFSLRKKEPEYNKPLAKRLLKDLKIKTERRRTQTP